MMFFIDGCVDPQSFVTVGVDESLPTIRRVKVLVEKSSVGFEWPAIKDPKAKGINVYRATPSSGKKQKFYKIATIDDHFATHYVDRTIQHNQRYLYTFTTYNLLHESPHGKIVRVQTSSPYKSVEFVKVYLRASGVIKVLWKPHPNPRISGYVVQRRLSNGNAKWRYLASVSGRLMPEFIDSSAAKGHTYSYRVIARSSSGVLSFASQPASIAVK
jgi:fibronectin type 3 domain-containing protein